MKDGSLAQAYFFRGGEHIEWKGGRLLTNH